MEMHSSISLNIYILLHRRDNTLTLDSSIGHGHSDEGEFSRISRLWLEEINHTGVRPSEV